MMYIYIIDIFGHMHVYRTTNFEQRFALLLLLLLLFYYLFFIFYFFLMLTVMYL